MPCLGIAVQTFRPTDYTPITEVPGSRATKEQLARLHHRYHLAKQLAAGRRVLEVACGAGMGLGYVADNARFITGGDYTEALLRVARGHYGHRIPLVRLDAQALPFRDASFDLVFMFEAIYYLSQPERFVLEAHRVLDRGGTLLIGTVNKDWPGFAPSLYSTKYLSVPELSDLLTNSGFAEPRMYAAFPEPTGTTRRMTLFLRHTAARLGLVPRSLHARERLKRLFYGKLTALPHEVTDDLPHADPPTPIPCREPNETHSIIYCVAQRRDE